MRIIRYLRKKKVPMSLKYFHIFFIVTALALMTFMTYWSGIRVFHGQDGQNVKLLAFALCSLAVGIPYLGWFLRKIN